MTFCNRLVAVVFAGLLASCSFQKASETEGARAPFEVLPVAVLDVRTTAVDAYGFPSERALQLKVCLRDSANLQPRVGESVWFEGSSDALLTDAEGCVFWTETIAYRHSAREFYVGRDRKFRAAGNQGDIRLAVNPWRSDRSIVIDRRTETPANLISASEAREALLGLGRFGENDFANVLVESASASAGTLDPKAGAVSYATTLSSFSLVRRTLDGTLVKEPMKSGAFTVAMTVTETGKTENVASSETREGHVSQGRISLGLPTTWKRLPDENTALEYVFSIVAPASSGLRPATAVLRTRNRLEVSGTLAESQSGAKPVALAPVTSAAKPPPFEPDALQISTISYALVRRVPEIDRYLGLSFHRVYDLVIRGSTYRPFASERGPAWERLRPGRRYVLKGAFVAASSFPPGKTPITAARYLNGFETEIEANGNGDLVGQAVLTVDFAEQPVLESRLRLAIEVRELQTTRDVRPAFVSIPFQALDEQGVSDGISTIQTPESLAQSLVPADLVWERGLREGITVAKPRALFTKSPRDLFLEHGDLPLLLKHIDLDAADDGAFAKTGLDAAGVTRETIASALGQDLFKHSFERAALAKKLCVAYSTDRPLAEVPRATNTYAHHRPQTMHAVDNRSDRERCRDNPLDWVKVRALTFVDAISKPASELKGELHRLDVSTSFFREKIETKREVFDGVLKTDSLEGGVMTKVGFEKFGNGVTAQFGYMHRHQWYSATERSNTDDLRRRYASMELRTLFADELEFELEAQTQRCVLIERTPSRTKLASHASFLFCKKAKDVVREAYYYVSDAVRTGRSPHLDPRDLRDRTWIKLLRGKREFADFQKAINDKTRAIVMKRVVPVGEGVDTLLHDAYLKKSGAASLQRDGGRFPGLLE